MVKPGSNKLLEQSGARRKQATLRGAGHWSCFCKPFMQKLRYFKERLKKQTGRFVENIADGSS